MFCPGNLDYKTVCSELRPVQHKYFEVFIALGVPHHKLKEFEKEADPMAASVDYWLKGNVEDAEHSWMSVVKGLRIAEEKELAEQIEGKFIHKGQY